MNDEQKHIYEEIIQQGVCPYCGEKIRVVGAWGAKGCPNKTCDFWRHHKKDWDAVEADHVFNVIDDDRG